MIYFQNKWELETRYCVTYIVRTCLSSRVTNLTLFAG